MSLKEELESLNLDPKLVSLLAEWNLGSPACLLVLQDELEDEFEDSKIVRPEKYKKKAQTAVGEALVLGKCLDDDAGEDNPRYERVKVGDHVKFAPGTQIAANVPGFPLVQLLHIKNVLMIKPKEVDDGKDKDAQADQIPSVGGAASK